MTVAGFMMKSRLSVLLGLLVFLGMAIVAAPARTESDPLIVPGKSLGKVRIGETFEQLHAQLGKPTADDIAMGRVINSWVSPHSRLDVLLRRRDDPDTFYVLDARTNSAFFHTADGLAVGSSVDAIRARFPDAQPVDVSMLPGKPVYDSVAHGIAFETDGAGHCTAIVVHVPRQAVRISYLAMP